MLLDTAARLRDLSGFRYESRAESERPGSRPNGRQRTLSNRPLWRYRQDELAGKYSRPVYVFCLPASRKGSASSFWKRCAKAIVARPLQRAEVVESGVLVEPAMRKRLRRNLGLYRSPERRAELSAADSGPCLHTTART